LQTLCVIAASHRVSTPYPGICGRTQPCYAGATVTDYLEQSLAKLKEFEGCVPWMYRDTVGKVTVGVGLMLHNAEAAEALPFFVGAHAASTGQIAAEFARVDAMPTGHSSSFYKTPSSLELPQEAIDAKLSAVLQHFESDLRTQLPHYDALPSTVKMALLDMIYNLGPAGLFKGFPHLIAAVKANAWTQAAASCMRHGPGPERNAWTREQFLSAVVTTIKAEAESWLTRIWLRLRHTMGGLFGSGR
jgi:GH24 family phage-related lysozyme (muramidase)